LLLAAAAAAADLNFKIEKESDLLIYLKVSV
jgi:hypothetical protein